MCDGDKEMWDVVRTVVDSLRDISKHRFARRCGLHPGRDAGRIKELYRGRRYLAPDYLVLLLDWAVGRIRKKFPGNLPDTDTIKTLIAAAAYGPPRCGPPPDVARLSHVARWAVNEPPQRALERVLCEGAKLPRHSWSTRWPGAAGRDVRLRAPHTGVVSPDEERNEIWDVVCSVVQSFWELPVDEFVKQCRLDRRGDADQIEELYRLDRERRCFLAPQRLAKLLDRAVDRIRETFHGELPDMDTIKTLIAAAAYGPPRCGPPPDVARLSHVARWAVNEPPQRALERLLCEGANFPTDSWSTCWPQAFRTLGYVIRNAYRGREPYSPAAAANGGRPRRGAIQQNIDWLIGKGLLDLPRGQTRADFARNEAAAYAAFVRGSLVMGCKCCKAANWEDLRLASLSKQRKDCGNKHSLDAWDRQEPQESLNDFVWRAGIGSDLPHVNGFRHGIMASYVCHFNNWAVYPVLKCEQKQCDGFISADNDRPAGCGQANGVSRANYWLCKKGRWTRTSCWCCKRRDRLFFQRAYHEENCSDYKWSKRRTIVWIPTGKTHHVANLPADRRADELVSCVLNELVRMEPQKIYTMLKLSHGTPTYAYQLQEFARLYFDGGLSEKKAALEAGIPPGGCQAAWKHLVHLLKWLWERLFPDEGPPVNRGPSIDDVLPTDDDPDNEED